MFSLSGQPDITSAPPAPLPSLVNDGFELDETLNYDLAPPTYDEVINSTRFPIVRTGTRTSCSSGNGYKLDFVDITPHLSQGTSTRQVGNFQTLLRRANTWLQSNADVNVKSCETITWMATTASQVNETNAVHRARSFSTAIKTNYMRGLRIWFVPTSPDQGEPRQNRICVEEVSPTKCDDTISGLVKRANTLFKNKGMPGRVLNIETVLARSKPGKIYASHTYWTENTTKEKQHAFFLRIFHLQHDGPVQPVVIGIKDFLPSQTTESYDKFSEVADKASLWITEQTDLSVVSLQGIFVKRKGTPQTSHDRCFYTEHPLKLESRITYYYQILRVGYIMKQPQELTLQINDVPPIITKKTFAPAMMPTRQDEQERRFEPFTKTVERVSSWLDSTGAEVFSVETVPVRMNTGAQQRYGPEATLVWSQPEPGVKFEDWLLFVRVYVKGEYHEPRMQHALSMPPVDWHRRLRENNPSSTTGTRSRRKRNCIIFCILFLLVVIAAFVIMYVSYSFVSVKEN